MPIMQNQPSWQLKDLSQIKEIDLQKTIEFKTFELAIDYLFSLEKWPPNHPVLSNIEMPALNNFRHLPIEESQK